MFKIYAYCAYATLNARIMNPVFLFIIVYEHATPICVIFLDGIALLER